MKNEKEEIKKTVTSINGGLNTSTIKMLSPFMNLKSLPKDVKISTMTVVCKFKTEFNVENIGRFISLNSDRIVYTKYGDKERLLDPKTKKKNKKKKSRSFYNQVTVKVNSTNEKPTNVKLFRNGSVQMTGCKSLENFIDVIKKLSVELKKVRMILNRKTMKSFIEKPFITNPENVDINSVYDVKIGMINCGFDIGFSVDRSNLYATLLKQDIECKFEPCVHACVDVKYYYKKDKRISIFVFESGKIIITGANQRDHIDKAHDYITKKLHEHYGATNMTSIDDFIMDADVIALKQALLA